MLFNALFESQLAAIHFRKMVGKASRCHIRRDLGLGASDEAYAGVNLVAYSDDVLPTSLQTTLSQPKRRGARAHHHR